MKRIFTVIGLLAIVHLAGVVGVGVFAYTRGWLEQDRVTRALAVLRGEEEAPVATTQEAETPEEAVTRSIAERIRTNQEEEERRRIELDRRDREIRDGWAMLEIQQLNMLRERESLEAEKQRIMEEQIARAEELDDSGAKRELDILQGLKSDQAKEIIRQKEDADVVRILMAMEPRKAQKLVASCKSTEERSWIGRILEQLHERDATQAEVLGGT